MNGTGTMSNQNQLAAWRGLFTMPDTAKKGLTAALYVVCALIIPFASNDSLCLIFIAACAGYYYSLTHTVTSLLPPAIPAVILYSITGNLLLPAVFFAVSFGAASAAMLIISTKSKTESILIALLPIAAYLISFFITSDPINALLTLLPLPCGITAAITLRRCSPFTGTVVSLTITLAATLIVAGIITLAAMDMLYGNFFSELVTALHDTAMTILNEANAVYAEAGISLSITETSLRNTISMLINLSPAVFIVICTITAFFANTVLHKTILGFGVLPRLPARITIPKISTVAALLFIASYLATLIAGYSSTTVFSVVTNNLALILEPGLAYLGFLSLLGHGASRSCFSVIVLFGMVAMLWWDPTVVPAVAAFWGSIQVLISRFISAKQS